MQFTWDFHKWILSCFLHNMTLMISTVEFQPEWSSLGYIYWSSQFFSYFFQYGVANLTMVLAIVRSTMDTILISYMQDNFQLVLYFMKYRNDVSTMWSYSHIFFSFCSTVVEWLGNTICGDCGAGLHYIRTFLVHNINMTNRKVLNQCGATKF